jgi:hypothetical protein
MLKTKRKLEHFNDKETLIIGSTKERRSAIYTGPIVTVKRVVPYDRAILCRFVPQNICADPMARAFKSQMAARAVLT